MAAMSLAELLDQLRSNEFSRRGVNIQSMTYNNTTLYRIRIPEHIFQESATARTSPSPSLNATILPVHVRGLFIAEDANGLLSVAVRGYDKFFNHKEVPQASLSYHNNSKAQTMVRAPVWATVKENGCAVYVGTLPLSSQSHHQHQQRGQGSEDDDDGSLVVTSKHNLPSHSAHAALGRKYLLEALKHKGVSPQKLTHFLRKHQITLAMELCDDTFEQHIFPYRGQAAGLYLHGIISNDLFTQKLWDPVRTKEVGDEFGLRCIKHIRFDSIPQCEEFISKCERGEDTNEIEGYVLRFDVDGSSNATMCFKLKLPKYQSWRMCREQASKFLAEGGSIGEVNDELVRKFLMWAAQRMNKQDIDDLKNNLNFVSLRERFEKDMESGLPMNAKGTVAVCVIGPPQSGRSTIAASIAQRLKWQCLGVNEGTGKLFYFSSSSSSSSSSCFSSSSSSSFSSSSSSSLSHVSHN
jgi:tRNA splicing ligase